MIKSNLEEVCFCLQFRVHHEEVRAGTRAGASSQELKQRPCRSTAYWFAQSLSSILQDHQQKYGTAHSGLSPPISVINQENALQSCLQAI